MSGEGFGLNYRKFRKPEGSRNRDSSVNHTAHFITQRISGYGCTGALGLCRGGGPRIDATFENNMSTLNKITVKPSEGSLGTIKFEFDYFNIEFINDFNIALFS